MLRRYGSTMTLTSTLSPASDTAGKDSLKLKLRQSPEFSHDDASPKMRNKAKVYVA